MLCLNAGQPHASKPNIQDERVDRQGDAVKRVPVRWGLFLALWCGLGSQAAIAADRAAQQAPATKVVHVSNVDLHYIESGSGVPVVFVHGSVDDYRSFEPQIAPLAQAYRAIAYSRRYNFPNAPRTPARNHSAIVEAEDLAGLLRALHAYPAHVVGHSYGAYTALILALRHPELVRTLTLAEPPLVRWLPGLADGAPLYEDFMRNMWLPAGREFRAGHAEQAMRVTIDWFGRNGYVIEGRPARYETLSAEVRDFMTENALEWQALTTSANAFPMIDRKAVRAIRTPVLLMSGENILPMNKLIDAELRRLLPQAEVAIIPGATHEMWAERPDECRAGAVAFFERH
jgi:non-heme chloroperoxidase